MTYEIRISGSDVLFSCNEGQSVLDAAMQAGIEVPYSCRKGVCGNCVGRVSQGEVQCPDSNMTEAGEHLFCQCLPTSNIEIEPRRWRRVDPSSRKRFTVKVFRNTLVAPDVSVLQLRLPTGQRAKFKAGQYLQVALPDGSRRSYSMANPPQVNDSLQLHIRHVPGGQFTQRVSSLASGDLLQVELPFGNFELREESLAPMLCVVGGTGFAPVNALLDDMVKRSIQREVILVWGAKDRHGIYVSEAIEKWKKRLPNFRFLPAIESAEDASALEGFHGRVDDALRAHAPASLSEHEVYCCGSPFMVNAVRAVCVDERGLMPEKFFSDVFVQGPSGATVANVADAG